MKLKRNLNVFVAMSLISASLLPVQAIETTQATNCHVRICAAGEDILGRTKLTVNQGMAYAYSGLESLKDREPTTADALVEGVYYSLFEEDPTIEDLQGENLELMKLSLPVDNFTSGWISSMYDTDPSDWSYSWMYSDNKTTPMTGFCDYKINDNSNVMFYYEDWTMGYRGYFDQFDYSIEEGQSLEAKVFAVPVCDEMYGNYTEVPVNAEVKITDNQGNNINIKCDEEGKFTLSDLKTGTYNLTANWSEDEYGWCFIPATATLSVKEKVVENIPEEDKQPEIDNKPVKNVDANQAYIDMKNKINSESLVNSAEDDIDAFWHMLASTAINNKPQRLAVDFEKLDYASMSPQKIAKTIIAMANNNYNVYQKIYNNQSIVDLLISMMEDDGSFSSTNRKGDVFKAYATEQVWCMMALEIVDAQYDQNQALNYLYSLQNEDKGFGYGTWSDVGTTSWILCLSDLLPMNKDIIDSANEYCMSQWDSLVQNNDSSSMNSYISTKRVTKSMYQQFLNTSYNEEGKYFSWGSFPGENAYAKYPSIQALGDFNNKQTVYQLLDEYYPLIIKDENNIEIDNKNDVEIENTVNSKENVKTGDQTIVATYVLIMMLASAIFFIAKSKYE